MSEEFKAVKITDKVYWVGAIDWTIRNFHGYTTSRGTTFNAYLVLGDKITLIDTVKTHVKDQLLSRISSVTNLENIDYIISNHSEMDHSGCIPDMIELCKPEAIYASEMGIKALHQHFNLPENILKVFKEGENLNLGDNKFSFYESRMLHWPDSAVSYLHNEAILFSNDIFGMHLASFERFDNEIDSCITDFESAKYFANIFLPYSQFTSKFLTKLNNLNLDIKYIATDHGPIWRKDINKIIQLYNKWSQQKPESKAVIVYDTMWGSTQKMANAIGEALCNSGINTKIISIEASNRSDIATELLDAGAFIIGAPILNGYVFPTIMDVMTYLKGLRLKNKITAAFGSYGWVESGLNTLKDQLQNEMKLEFVGDTIKVNYVPNENDLKNCYELGIQIANRLKEVVQ